MKIALVVPGGVDRSGEYRVIPVLLAFIKRLATRHEVHVFATHQEQKAASWSLMGARVRSAGSRMRRLRTSWAILREHRAAPFDLVHSFWAGASGFAAVAAAKVLGIPSVVHVSGGELAALPCIGYGGALTWHRRWLHAAIVRNATSVTAASRPIVEQIAAMGVRAERIPLGVDLQAWPPRAPARRDPMHPVRLIHLASLNRVKDQTTLLAALSILAADGLAFHLDVVGEDTLAGHIQRLAQQGGLTPRITFHGFLTHRNARPLFDSAHLNLISSLHEAGPLAVLEAAVAGVPTVGTSVGHIAEWAPEAAVAVPVADPQALAAAIARVSADEDLRLTIAREAFRRATNEDADATVRDFEELYRRLASP
jgi:glycosyltransferase involved in cell wall biosynthesis